MEKIDSIHGDMEGTDSIHGDMEGTDSIQPNSVNEMESVSFRLSDVKDISCVKWPDIQAKVMCSCSDVEYTSLGNMS